VSKVRSKDGRIATDLFIFVDDICLTGFSSKKLGSQPAEQRVFYITWASKTHLLNNVTALQNRELGLAVSYAWI
jgi:hypothetical protein